MTWLVPAALGAACLLVASRARASVPAAAPRPDAGSAPVSPSFDPGSPSWADLVASADDTEATATGGDPGPTDIPALDAPAAPVLPTPDPFVPSFLSTIMTTARQTFATWKPPATYASAIRSAEVANGIPQDILARLLYQECHWRADIISGATRSPAGAIGIAQFMPATAAQFGIDPRDPFASIDAAGRYLGQLYRQFGNWTQALAAYNWGQGNVQRKGLAAAPAETQRYFTDILADVNVANGTNYA